MGRVPTRPSPSPGITAARDERMRAAAQHARDAQARGDDATANEAWRRYRLIRDAGRDPDELIAEGVELSKLALSLLRAR